MPATRLFTRCLPLLRIQVCVGAKCCGHSGTMWTSLAKPCLIREKKRNHGQLTNRRVPLSPFLVQVLRDWLDHHPGGQSLFCHPLEVVRSRKTRLTFTPLTRNEAHDHFHRTLNGSKWQVLRGWHVLRHSFASNCAAAGVDQRFVNSWMGHMTEAMVRRYQHLRPDKQREAMELVFGHG